MPDTGELRSVVAAAERAAADGDYETAEQLLRDAAWLQEASLGPLDPDLANTLNNLGIVCEITGKLVDAERSFRRAYAIATAVLEPDHPFVATSRKNLEDFCRARGVPVESPTPPTAAAAERDVRATGFADLRRERPSGDTSRPVAAKTRSRPLTIGVAIAVGLFVTLVATRSWFRANEGLGSSPRSSSPSPPSGPLPTARSPFVEPIPTDVPRETATNRRAPVGVGAKTGDTASTTPAGREVRGPASASPPAAVSGAAVVAGAAPPLVTDAHLCRDLSTGGPGGSSGDWQCVPPSLPLGPGLLFFYTRLTSPSDTTVQHRWYRGDRLRQVVELPIRANTSSGYRTYSRNTIGSEGSGDWRVELRTRDGVLLHEERFVVR